jgi:hypothetical protein
MAAGQKKRSAHYRSHQKGVCRPGKCAAKTALPCCAPCLQYLGPVGQHRKPIDDDRVGAKAKLFTLVRPSTIASSLTLAMSCWRVRSNSSIGRSLQRSSMKLRYRLLSSILRIACTDPHLCRSSASMRKFGRSRSISASQPGKTASSCPSASILITPTGSRPKLSRRQHRTTTLRVGRSRTRFPGSIVARAECSTSSTTGIESVTSSYLSGRAQAWTRLPVAP